MSTAELIIHYVISTIFYIIAFMALDIGHRRVGWSRFIIGITALNIAILFSVRMFQ